MITYTGFETGAFGRKLPSDTTLNNMRKTDLIALMHIAEGNYKALEQAYRVAVNNSKCNICPLGKQENLRMKLKKG